MRCYGVIGTRAGHAWFSLSRVVAMAVLVLALAACGDSHQGGTPSGPTPKPIGEFGPLRAERLDEDVKWCIRAAQQRIVALGKKPYHGDDWWGPANRLNIDSKTGEERADIWVGPHLFSFPRALHLAISSGLWMASLPGRGAYIQLDLPGDQPATQASVAANPLRIGDIPTVINVKLDCRRDYTMQMNLERAGNKANMLKSMTDMQAAVLVRKNGLIGYESATAGEYFPESDVLKTPSGGYLWLLCTPPRAYRPDLDKCLFSFAYRDLISADLQQRRMW